MAMNATQVDLVLSLRDMGLFSKAHRDDSVEVT